MRCITCEKLSFSIICTKCQETLLIPSFYKREISKDFFVYSFYKFDEVKELLNTKYQFYGDKVLNILAILSFKKFSKNFKYNEKVYAVPLDDHTRHQFSHTAILAKQLKSKYIKPLFNTLKATNIVKYAGKDLAFRKNNKRDFIFSGINNINILLIILLPQE